MLPPLPPALRRHLPPALTVVALLLLPGCQGCGNGLTSAHPVPVPDGAVVLVRSADGFGAFVPLNQQIGAAPESLDYVWFFRTNGGGTFATNDPAVRSGSSNAATGHIRFANFAVPWSGTQAGYGWIYYPRDQHGGARRGDWQLCITVETNPATIRPDDPRWHYRRRPPFSWESEKRWLRSQLP